MISEEAARRKGAVCLRRAIAASKEGIAVVYRRSGADIRTLVGYFQDMVLRAQVSTPQILEA